MYYLCSSTLKNNNSKFEKDYAAEKNSVRCVTGSGPLIAGEGNINADTGVFSLTMKGLQEGVSIGRWIFTNGFPSMPIAFASEPALGGGGETQQLGYAPKTNSTELTLGLIKVVEGTGGIGVWENENSFNNCGSTEFVKIENDRQAKDRLPV